MKGDLRVVTEEDRSGRLLVERDVGRGERALSRRAEGDRQREDEHKSVEAPAVGGPAPE
jgi:hypothetical protein